MSKIRDVLKQRFFLFVSGVGFLSFLLGLLFSLFGLALLHFHLPSDLTRLTHDMIVITALIVISLLLLLGVIITRFGVMARRLNQEIIRREGAERGHLMLERALQQSQKMQAVGTLAGGIAHDFNNILFSIMGYTAMAREDLDRATLSYKNLGKVLEASERGKDLVARILMFSGQRSHHFALIQFSDVLDQALSLIRPAVRAGISIETKINVEKSFVIGDLTQLQQVLVNIITNAIHASQSHGVIRIFLDRFLVSPEFFEKHPNLKQESYFALSVQDEGVGMDDVTMARIFEPFYTTKTVGEGTGLGLSTAHGIIKEHQGDILVKSRVNQGSTFSVLLPEYIAT